MKTFLSFGKFQEFRDYILGQPNSLLYKIVCVCVFMDVLWGAKDQTQGVVHRNTSSATELYIQPNLYIF
jgi:hypothetical protein